MAFQLKEIRNMPKSVGCWKEIENVSLPLTWSYGARCCDLIITELESWTRSTGSRPDHVIVFLGKTLDSHSAQCLSFLFFPPPPQSINGCGELSGKSDKSRGGGNLAMDWHLILGVIWKRFMRNPLVIYSFLHYWAASISIMYFLPQSQMLFINKIYK